MADFVRLGGRATAINMDLVSWVEWADEGAGTLALTFHDGRVRILGGVEAERVLVWMEERFQVPSVPHVSEEGRL
jgi:hypothetical protein